MVLLEVIIALGIFVMVAFGLVLALTYALDAGKARGQADRLLLRLQNELALARGARLTVQEQDLPVDLTGITAHLSIRLETLVDQDRQPVPNIYRVTVTARDRTGDSREVSELFYQP